jgi:T4 superinfection immunity protein
MQKSAPRRCFGSCGFVEGVFLPSQHQSAIWPVDCGCHSSSDPERSLILARTAERRTAVFGSKIGAKHFLATFYASEYAGPAFEETVVPPDSDQKAPEVQDGTLGRRLMLLIIVESVSEALLIAIGAAFLFLTASYLIQRDSFEIAPLVIMVLYPLPIGVAAVRKHNRVLHIMITNFWLGWTIIGWMFALLWACDWNVESDQE